MDTMRQNGIIDPSIVKQYSFSIIGVGAVGSFAALALSKMGAGNIVVYDEDGVTAHNIPNQFYRIKDAEDAAFKVTALLEIIKDFTGSEIKINLGLYENQPLSTVVIVATDSMSSRRMVWEQFKTQVQCQHLIEARMGGEIARIYSINKKDGILSQEDISFYEDTLYSDTEAVNLPCTERAIIYNVLMIAAFICRSFKAITKRESFKREVIFNMAQMEEDSLVYMGRK